VADLTQEWDAAIIGMARQYGRSYPMVDWEDIAQELRLWWLRSKKAAEYVEEGAEGRRKINTSLAREAMMFCHREKAAIVGYKIEDMFFYSTGQLRDLLPLVFDYDNWFLLGQTDDVGGTKRDPAEGNDALAQLADVTLGLGGLDKEDQELLVLLYRDGYTEQEMADYYEVPCETLRKRHYRALKRLQKRLGGPRPTDMHEGPGARKALTNSQAAFLTRLQDGREVGD
jgi:RNA polymerase sigma factor (sigma-70 family)